MTLRYYVNNAPQQTLASSITNNATTLTIAGSFAGWPASFPFYATLDYGQLSEEIVLVTNIVGTTATVTRGQDGSAGVSHAAGATLDFTVVAQDYRDANTHVNNNTGVHGVSGNVVGTSDTQTLTNKTYSGGATSGTWTGTMAAAGLTITSPVLTTPSMSSPTLTGTMTGSGSINISGASTAASYTASGNGQVSGVHVPTTYANEAAATAAGANVNGAIVWLTTPTTAGTAAGLFVYSSSLVAWVPYKRPRIGARATTNATQALTASVAAILNNGGTAAWTATEDSGGFVSGAGGSTAPIVVPAGLGGLYLVGFHFLVSAVPTGLIWGSVLVNGAGLGTNGFASGWQITRASGSAAMQLNAGDTLGVEGLTSTAANASVGCFLYAYRISD